MALTRLCKDEIAQKMGREVIDTNWDSLKVLRLVVEEMVASGFDHVFLAVSMQFHLAPRVLRRGGHHSLPFTTTSSIFAGMKESRMYA